MARVNLEINGRKYALGCDDGEEERLLRLGKILNDRVQMMADQFGQIGDVRLLVMAGITLADELDELNANIDSRTEDISNELRRKSEAAQAQAEKSQMNAADALADAARRIEELAEKLQRD
ncbi:MAG TPA: cell division protein ZapA [Hellea balneolensis]|uniref:Cell division protein ZapA n=1 Tax=Hellea balneolensis TaxID=287478 RepID=A0A7V5U151_9PROT|nr:cell division protein ZapA [Hellea balneolensis]